MTLNSELLDLWNRIEEVNRYNTILIDPPWPVAKMIPEGASSDLRPSRHSTNLDYPTMTLPEIRALPLSTVMSDNCHIYLWTTQKHLPNALDLFKDWGIHYHCTLPWIKHCGVVAFSFCFNVEFLIFGYRGEFRVKKYGIKQDIQARSTGHSIKPELSYDRIEQVSFGPYLELFARRKRPGWDVWGNQVKGIEL